MKKLKIINIDNNYYTLKDNEERIYRLTLIFHNTNIIPKLNDYIYLNHNLINKKYEEYSECYIFGPLDSNYGRKITNKNEQDLIKIQTDNNSIYLKRLYG